LIVGTANQANALFWVEEDLEQLYERHLAKVISTPETQGECSVSL
jgi:hypothetical protein